MRLPRQHLHLELAERFEVLCPRQSLNRVLSVRFGVQGQSQERSASANAPRSLVIADSGHRLLNTSVITTLPKRMPTTRSRSTVRSLAGEYVCNSPMKNAKAICMPA